MTDFIKAADSSGDAFLYYEDQFKAQKYSSNRDQGTPIGMVRNVNSRDSRRGMDAETIQFGTVDLSTSGPRSGRATPEKNSRTNNLSPLKRKSTKPLFGVVDANFKKVGISSKLKGSK